MGVSQFSSLHRDGISHVHHSHHHNSHAHSRGLSKGGKHVTTELAIIEESSKEIKDSSTKFEKALPAKMDPAIRQLKQEGQSSIFKNASSAHDILGNPQKEDLT